MIIVIRLSDLEQAKSQHESSVLKAALYVKPFYKW